MPHDRNGNEIRPGDRVTVECEVESVTMQADYCNVTLKTCSPMPPYSAPTTLVLNAQQVTLAHDHAARRQQAGEE